MRQNTLVTVLSLGLLAAVLGAVVVSLGGDIPPLPNLETQNRFPDDENVNERIQSLFTISAPPELLTQDAAASPFFTRHFAPPPKPQPAPPQKTKKVKIDFQGIYTNTKETQKAFLRVDGELKAVKVNELIVADLRLMNLDSNTIMVGSTEADQQSVGFRQSATFEIPQ
ncbi:MAG: hypothetical protein M2R45_04041 [Verrucomicrobia subdivision 3 bacterium]|nr:hypothetical protein [Limisphaerales bacterium]MCS1416975.1 hypothetical protein [Limisphaerales bacterium]